VRIWSRRNIVSIIVLILCLGFCVVINLKVILGPAPASSADEVEPRYESPIDYAPEWLRWMSLGLVLAGYAALTGVIVVINRRVERIHAEVIEDVSQHPPKDITGMSGPPREPLAKLLKQLEQYGFKSFGEYNCRYTKDKATTAWVTINPEGTVRAIGIMPDWANLPTCLLSSLFPDDALLETRTPSTASNIRRPDYQSTAQPTLEKALAVHTRDLDRFSAVHGPAIPVKTMAEYLDLTRRAHAYTPDFFASTRRGRYTIPLLFGGMVFLIAYYLIFSLDGAPMVCAGAAVLLGVIMGSASGSIWYRWRRMWL
jgi:hypothetical protein